MAASRDGRVLASLPWVGTLPAATLVAAVGNIMNLPDGPALKAYIPWSPHL
jgi:hypothetical protein